MRCLWTILMFFCFATTAFAQTPTNPTEANCGLPAQGVIVESVTYNLRGNCTQTGILEIKASETPSVHLTINGNGHTIFASDVYVRSALSKGWIRGMNFIVVDDNGYDTDQEFDNTRSPNVKVTIRDVTFDGNGLRFRGHPRRGINEDGTLQFTENGDPWYYHGSGGSGILAEGSLTLEDVTFTNAIGVWVRAKGAATLKNVLFEDSYISSFGFYPTIPAAALHVATSASATLNNAVFRDLQRTVVAVQAGGSLRATGCLSFIRVLTHKVHHSGLYSGMGTFSDSSTGPCTGEIGNNGQAVVAYTLPEMPCGVPSSGTITGTHVYTLDQDCVCVNHPINIGIDASVTINANGHQIVGCKQTRSHTALLMGSGARLTINNARISRLRFRNYGGTLTIRDSVISGIEGVAVVNYGWSFLRNNVFDGNAGDSDSSVYWAHGHFGRGRALFHDNVFRNNGPVAIEALTTGSSTRIYLCGENIIEGLPQDENAEAFATFIAENGGNVSFSCLEPDPPVPNPPPPTVGCAPAVEGAPPEKKNLGGIGVVLYVEKCPLTVEIWEVLPSSQGQFALRVSQDLIETMNEGDIICSANGRAAVRIGMTEPVRQIMAYSKTYVPPSRRGGRDILISLGPNYEAKVHHLVIDHALDGTVMGVVDTRPAGPPCEGLAGVANLFNAQAAPAAPAPPAPPPPTPIPIAAPVFPQPAQADGSIVHVVQPGDTIWAMGVAYDVHPYRIIALNDLDDPSTLVVKPIFPGQELLIRPAS